VHTIAGLLKLYFRKLPDPLCCHSLYREWLNSYDPNDAVSTRNRLKNIIKKLPHTNYLIMTSLVSLLSRICSESETKMSANNLAICWAPNILRPHEESTSAVLLIETNSVNMIITILIRHFKELFEELGSSCEEPFSYFQTNINNNNQITITLPDLPQDDDNLMTKEKTQDEVKTSFIRKRDRGDQRERKE